jgi:transcriptional regulator with GAF, ATPase, and Fis domain
MTAELDRLESNDNRTVQDERASDPSRLVLTQYKLVVLSGGRKGHEVTVSGDVFRIGKADDNDLCLKDDTVSRNHCQLLRDSRGFLVRDLGSTNGTFLDGTKIREAYLGSGTVVSVGKVELRFIPFEERVQVLPSDRDTLGELRGRSLPMRQIFSLLERVAPTEATVLLQGETGVGKDLVARTLHQLSRRSSRPFGVVDCGAVASNLIESELFGHEKGSFTGASETRVGAFEAAQGGSVFLDELGELPLDLQPKLLRVLESREVRRVGSNRPIKLDIRVIAATHRNLPELIDEGRFREDLYFRISVVPIVLPPLRERREDIPLLIDDFLLRMEQAVGERPELPERTRQLLCAHSWPGNVRELRNVLERAAYLGPSAAEGLLSSPRDGDGADDDLGLNVQFDPSRSHHENREAWNEELERRYLRWLVDRNGSNVSRAAREAGMDRRYLHRLLKRYGVSGGGGDEG